MKVRITFKTPDVVEQTLQDTKESEISSILREAEESKQPISDWEAEEMVDSKIAQLGSVASQVHPVWRTYHG
jgi:hypothetical protein